MKYDIRCKTLHYDMGPEFTHKASFDFLSSTEVLTDGIIGSDMPDSIAEVGETDKINVSEISKGKLDENDTTASDEVEKKKLKPDEHIEKSKLKSARPVGNKKAKSIQSKEQSLSKMAKSYGEMAESGKERVRLRDVELALRRQE